MHIRKLTKLEGMQHVSNEEKINPNEWKILRFICNRISRSSLVAYLIRSLEKKNAHDKSKN